MRLARKLFLQIRIHTRSPMSAEWRLQRRAAFSWRPNWRPLGVDFRNFHEHVFQLTKVAAVQQHIGFTPVFEYRQTCQYACQTERTNGGGSRNDEIDRRIFLPVPPSFSGWKIEWIVETTGKMAMRMSRVPASVIPVAAASTPTRDPKATATVHERLFTTRKSAWPCVPLAVPSLLVPK
jgi:hypothetical protein